MFRCDVHDQAKSGTNEAALLRQESMRVLARVKLAEEPQENAEHILCTPEVQELIAQINKDHPTNVRKVLKGV